MAETLLLVEHEPAASLTLYRILKRDGVDVVMAGSPEAALQVLSSEPISVCITERDLPDMDGLELLRRARAQGSRAVFVLLADAPGLDVAIEAMRAGAWDVVPKPFLKPRLEAAIDAARERARTLRAETSSAPIASPTGVLRGESRGIREVLELVERVGPSAATVLIRGESGTGKEMVASELQRRSRRRHGPFIKVNCAALPDTLLESELFGHEKGAFTGAVRTKKGRFELAHGGTIFLDEIGDLSAGAQTKLLRVLQEGTFDRVGATHTQAVDVRVLAATNADLERAVAEKRFREDLYYRLRVIEIVVPPLRERREDIALLAEHFLTTYAARNGKPVRSLEPAALSALLEHDWPGNVRELENAVERAVVLCRGSRLSPVDLGMASTARPMPHGITFTVGTRLEEIERRMLAETLRWTDGDKTRAAGLLGITARTIYRKLERRRRALERELPIEAPPPPNGIEPATTGKEADSIVSGAEPSRDPS